LDEIYQSPIKQFGFKNEHCKECEFKCPREETWKWSYEWQLEQMKVQAKFNEALKVNKNAQIFLTPGGAVPNIWVDSKGASKSDSRENIVSRME